MHLVLSTFLNKMTAVDSPLNRYTNWMWNIRIFISVNRVAPTYVFLNRFGRWPIFMTKLLDAAYNNLGEVCFLGYLQVSGLEGCNTWRVLVRQNSLVVDFKYRSIADSQIQLFFNGIWRHVMILPYSMGNSFHTWPLFLLFDFPDSRQKPCCVGRICQLLPWRPVSVFLFHHIPGQSRRNKTEVIFKTGLLSSLCISGSNYILPVDRTVSLWTKGLAWTRTMGAEFGPVNQARLHSSPQTVGPVSVTHWWSVSRSQNS